MKGRVASGVLVISFALAAGCGGSGTSSSGTFNCNGGSVQLGPGLTCDESTSPPTIKVQFGSGAGTVAQGNDSRFSGGKYLGTFTPTVAQSDPPTLSSPGGFISNVMGTSASHNGGGLIYNAKTGRIGVGAADEICSTITNWPGQSGAVSGAHACSTAELIRNAHAGNIPEGATGLAYGLFQSAYAPGGTTDPNAIDSFKATCGDWTYDSADMYQATTWSVEKSDPKLITTTPGLATSLRFIAGKSCGGAGPVAYPIACCE